ncbi:hypothetical protein D3C80_1790280 [compost metagenome]
MGHLKTLFTVERAGAQILFIHLKAQPGIALLYVRHQRLADTVAVKGLFDEQRADKAFIQHADKPDDLPGVAIRPALRPRQIAIPHQHGAFPPIAFHHERVGGDGAGQPQGHQPRQIGRAARVDRYGFG